jgi:predicted nucleotidyltransferase
VSIKGGFVKRDDVLRILRAHRAEIEQRFGIRQMALFGSFARDEATEESDVDLAILQMDRPNLWTIAEAMGYLRDLLQKEIDIGRWESIRTYYRQMIEKDLIRVF